MTWSNKEKTIGPLAGDEGSYEHQDVTPVAQPEVASDTEVDEETVREMGSAATPRFFHPYRTGYATKNDSRLSDEIPGTNFSA